MDAKPAEEDQEKKVEAEEATKRAAALDELEKAVDSGEYREPIDMLKWLKSQETMPPSLKLAIEKQLRWYKMNDEADEDYASQNEAHDIEEGEGGEEVRRGRAPMGDEAPGNSDDATRFRQERGT